MKKKENNKSVANQWGNGNDTTLPPFEFETLMQNAKNIFFVAFIQTQRTPSGVLFALAGAQDASKLAPRARSERGGVRIRRLRR